MGTLRQIVTWGTPTAIGVLAVLSIVGAFIGDERAHALFNSWPLVVFWVLFGGLLLLGFLGYRSLLRRPGLLVMHLGSLLILGGSMWASDKGHAVASRLLGAAKIPSGMLVIYRGQTTASVLDPNTELPIGALPFALRLDDFRIEYYPLDEKAWVLSVGTLVHGQRVAYENVRWKLGEATVLPETGIRVKVLQYLASARPVTDKDGNVVGAEADPAAGTPAMQVLVESGAEPSQGWLVVGHGESDAELPLPVPHALAGDAHTMPVVLAQSLLLKRPRPAIRQYVSDVTILEGGREAGRSSISVNHPLHWGGYHFYQSSYDARAQQYTVLSAHSDSGLAVVYTGFLLTVGGAFWRFWLSPAWRGLFHSKEAA
jgi:hypothetical protein